MKYTIITLLLVLYVSIARSQLTYCNADSPPSGFSWGICPGGGPYKTSLQSISITPFPIVLGANMTLQFNSLLNVTVNNITAQDFAADIYIYKYIFGVWVYIPCVDGLGSCSFDDVCELFDYLNQESCSEVKKWNMPCKCPIPAGSYSIPNPGAKVFLTNPNVSWLTNGNYCLAAEIYNPNESILTCYNFYLQLTAAEDGSLMIS